MAEEEIICESEQKANGHHANGFLLPVFSSLPAGYSRPYPFTTTSTSIDWRMISFRLKVDKIASKFKR